ncbi:uncharacterized protein BT62DRAFT_936912, partial [Guyanagaster necrorhizus]
MEVCHSSIESAVDRGTECKYKAESYGGRVDHDGQSEARRLHGELCIALGDIAKAMERCAYLSDH